MKISILFFLSFFFTTVALSQTNDATIVEITELTPNSFKEIMLSSIENDNLKIEEACVPAEVLCIQYTGENEANKNEEILSFFSEFSNLGEVKILANHSVDDFREKCHQARIGK